MDRTEYQNQPNPPSAGTGIGQALPTPGVAQALPTPGVAQALPTPGVAQALPTPGAAQALPTPGAAQALPRPDRLLQFFTYAHLPPRLQDVSRSFAELAHQVAANLPANPERTVALRKLLEAKDCAVRAVLDDQDAPAIPRV